MNYFNLEFNYPIRVWSIIYNLYGSTS